MYHPDEPEAEKKEPVEEPEEELDLSGLTGNAL